MPRIKLEMPEKFPFACSLSVRISDVNYGGHLGNDAVLSFFHEARLQYLISIGCSELDAFGTGLIMADTAVNYLHEGFHGDQLKVEVAPAEITSRGFALFYRISCLRDHESVAIAQGRTGMLCFDYTIRKVASLPAALKQRLEHETPDPA